MVEAVDEPSAKNQPMAVQELAANQPTTVQEFATNQPTQDRENATKEPTEGDSNPAGSRKTGRRRAKPVYNGGDAGLADREPKPEIQAEIERVAPYNRVGDEIARRAMIKAENVRKLDQQWWREAEAAEVACRSRNRGHQ